MYGKLICFSLLVALASCHVRRELTASQSVEEFFTEARQSLDNARKHIEDMVEGKSSEGVQELFSNATRFLLEKTQNVQTRLENDLKSISDKSISQLVSEASDKLKDTAQQLKETLEKENPAVGDYTKTLQDTIKALVTEGQKVAEAVKPQVDEYGQNLGKLARDTVSNIVKGVDKLQNKIHEETKHGDH